MIIHVYCSYRLSPVGYQYGILKYPLSGSGDTVALSPPERNRVTAFVTKAFDNGFITGAVGNIPGSVSYLLLVKKRQYSYPEGHADIGKDVSMNLAFEFNDFDEFSRFYASFTKEDREHASKLNRMLADMIYPDYAATTYGLTIRRSELCEFIEKMRTAQPDAVADELRTHMKIDVLSAKKDYSEDLNRLFPPQDGYSWTGGNGKTYVYGKKKHNLLDTSRQSPEKLLVPLIILFVLLLLFLLLRHQSAPGIRAAKTRAEVTAPTVETEARAESQGKAKAKTRAEPLNQTVNLRGKETKPTTETVPKAKPLNQTAKSDNGEKAAVQRSQSYLKSSGRIIRINLRRNVLHVSVKSPLVCVRQSINGLKTTIRDGVSKLSKV